MNNTVKSQNLQISKTLRRKNPNQRRTVNNFQLQHKTNFLQLRFTGFVAKCLERSPPKLVNYVWFPVEWYQVEADRYIGRYLIPICEFELYKLLSGTKCRDRPIYRPICEFELYNAKRCSIISATNISNTFFRLGDSSCITKHMECHSGLELISKMIACINPVFCSSNWYSNVYFSISSFQVVIYKSWSRTMGLSSNQLYFIKILLYQQNFLWFRFFLFRCGCRDIWKDVQNETAKALFDWQNENNILTNQLRLSF